MHLLAELFLIFAPILVPTAAGGLPLTAEDPAQVAGEPGSAAAAPAPENDDETEPAEPAAGPLPEVFGRLQRWRQQLRRSKGALDDAYFTELEGHVGELRLYWTQQPIWRKSILLELLDLLGLALKIEEEYPRPTEGFPPLAPIASRARKLAVLTLRPRLDRDVLRWLEREVLVLERLHSAERRAGAVHLMTRERSPNSLLPLFMCARGSDALVRDQAIRALAGWNDEAVFHFFIEELIKAQTGQSVLNPLDLERHFKLADVCPPGRTSSRILRYVRRTLGSGHWREAARGMAVVPAITNNVAIPLLIEFLELWAERGAAGNRAKRIQFEISRELERRTGRTIGMHPDRWKRWWSAVQAGEIPPPGNGSEGSDNFSKATFFGLRPMSDRVTFVIDRSASMQAAFRNPDRGETSVSRSRYHEAVEQMIRFMEAAGEEARFSIVLFHSGAHSWRSRLVKATPGNLEAARSWLLARRPNGNTMLRMGMERAMMLKANGLVNLHRLEADTIIVLCDGATFEGPDWVRPVLRRSNHEARLMIHGVQIGGGGDGTLQLLAEETGGDFVAFDG